MLKNLPQSMVCWTNAGLIPGLRPANERRRYFKFVTTSLISRAQTQNQPWNGIWNKSCYQQLW